MYEGEAKTDPKDAWVLAGYARRNADRLNWVEVSDQSLARMRVLCGHDEDLAADQTRLINRLREALLSLSPALERILGSRLACRGVLDALGRYPTPDLMRQAGRARLRDLIHKRSPKLSAKVSQQIWEALKTQTTYNPKQLDKKTGTPPFRRASGQGGPCPGTPATIRGCRARRAAVRNAPAAPRRRRFPKPDMPPKIKFPN